MLATLATGYYIFLQLHTNTTTGKLDTISVTIGDGIFTLYAPHDSKGMQDGLAVFDSLPETHGMIFRGMPDGIQTFWMKNMKFDIDIIWVNDDDSIIYIAKNVSKHTYPQKFSNPAGTVSHYVIELGAGTCDTYKIAVGTKVRFD